MAKRHSKHWFRELLRARFRSHLPVAADISRYLPHKRKATRLWIYRSVMIREVAHEFNAALIYGPRGGLWSAVWVAPGTELTPELQLRQLGEEIVPGTNLMLNNEPTPRWQQRQRRWYIRHYKGEPVLCIRIACERRWYDIRGWKLVA